MRDSLCDLKYLQETIEFKRENIDEDKEEILILTKDEEKGIQKYPRANKDIIYATKVEIFQLLHGSIRAKYSLGTECEELEKDYEELVWAVSEIGWKKIGYVHFIQVFSLGILLEVPDEMLKQLIKVADEGELDDCLFDFLVQACGLTRELSSKGYQKENPYKETSSIIELSHTDKKAASKELKNYMKKKWFQGHYDYEWKNAHKRAGYVGLWSFETAALAKILQLDDGELQDNNHYPYDLAHYKSGKVFTVVEVQYVQPQKPDIAEVKIEENRELEQIVPNEFRDLINQLIKDYRNLSDTEFWTKYSLGDIWYTVDEYIKENKEGKLLGNIIVNILAEKDYILQLDYKEDIDEYISNMKNHWQEQDVKLVHFELGNDQYYYALVPKDVSIKQVYEVAVLEEDIEA